MFLLDKLAENKIKTAIESGELENLAGAGAPMQIDDDSHIPAELRAGMRILKNSGYLPKEIAIVREIRQIEALLCQVESPDEKTQLVTKLSLLKSRISKV